MFAIFKNHSCQHAYRKFLVVNNFQLQYIIHVCLFFHTIFENCTFLAFDENGSNNRLS